jgi:catechol 2,3-dioxygenase-like lactoylglutathione lyase family enzyme
MERVIGIGGVFFKAEDPKSLQQWYADNLGIAPEWATGSNFPWRRADQPDIKTYTAWSLFPKTTRYFDPSGAPFMINYQVTDLKAMLAQLRAAGAAVDENVEESEFGKFGWVTDPEGNRIELWEPPARR